jgi:hypothetical protein
MKAGSFNVNDYINKLYEEADNSGSVSKEGLIIPPENKKSYDWLKKEYQKAQTEVKVEMKIGDSKFTPGYDLQTKLDSVKDFKPGMFGDVKTGDTEPSSKTKGEDKSTVNDLKQEKIGDKGVEKTKQPEKSEKPETKPVKKDDDNIKANVKKTEPKKDVGDKSEKKDEKSKTKGEKPNIKSKKIEINLKSKKKEEDADDKE